MGKSILTREALLAAAPKTIELDVPDLGGTVWLRGMMAGDLIAFQTVPARSGDDKTPSEFGPRLIATALVDEAGKRLLGDDDWPAIKQWPAGAYQQVLAAAMELNGYRRSAEGNG